MGYKILVADDEIDAVDSISKHLSRSGYEVITANDGLDALNKIREMMPDVVLLDIMMPGMNGFEILKEMRSAKPLTKWQPVIIISSQNEFENLRKGYDLEADFYITKPFNIEKISNAVEMMISLIPLRKMDIEQPEGPEQPEQ
jgi:DNA-binding response OmpR family regulator